MDYEIKSIQEALNIVGHYSGPVDGIVGPKTTAGIKSFQKASGLSADGIIGPASAPKLAEALGKASVRAAGLKGYFEGSGSGAADDM
jgi:peptidoglycan hydrolase-like protein with peptidoglycan-binding domain